jgi:transposase InsO family protein
VTACSVKGTCNRADLGKGGPPCARRVLRPRPSLVLENLALGQQLAILRRSVPRPRLRPVDRAFWVIRSRTWSRWVEALLLGLEISAGRPSAARRRDRRSDRTDVRRDSLLESAPNRERAGQARSRRRQGHGGEVNAEAIAAAAAAPVANVACLYARAPRGHHRHRFPCLADGEVPLALRCFVRSLERRRLLHVNVTSHPHQFWTAQQIVEAVGVHLGIVRLIRDRDQIYGGAFDSRVSHLGVKQIKIAPRSPWQNGYAERFVGTLRREVLDPSSCSLNATCSDWFGRTRCTTTKTDPTWRSLATRQSRGPSSRRVRATSLPLRELVAFTIATRGRHDRPDQFFRHHKAMCGASISRAAGASGSTM